MFIHVGKAIRTKSCPECCFNTTMAFGKQRRHFHVNKKILVNIVKVRSECASTNQRHSETYISWTELVLPAALISSISFVPRDKTIIYLLILLIFTLSVFQHCKVSFWYHSCDLILLTDLVNKLKLTAETLTFNRRKAPVVKCNTFLPFILFCIKSFPVVIFFSFSLYRNLYEEQENNAWSLIMTNLYLTVNKAIFFCNILPAFLLIS